jgi:predicted DNA-binding transcriptional regulator AlpA
MQQLLTIEQVANVLALSSATVMNWSYGRKPAPKLFPQPIKVGNRLRYLESEVEHWIAAKSGLRWPGFFGHVN